MLNVFGAPPSIQIGLGLSETSKPFTALANDELILPTPSSDAVITSNINVPL